ncbi:hypothetical protein MKK88_30825 [Methylobacterium sp. E-005]|uniref:hypothetical protein n=1 Tax=Methylobacterium sp. E-005 TaxID=2836549 RepID=UPI001FBBC150|nr:hypothetical protein [Methylobacterium sp. E-005]MCJ2090347.1 hypothetical protein [Methylobacterium sp. E-005]
MMRQVLVTVAGAPGRLAASGAALATVVLTAGGHLQALAVSAWMLLVWGLIFAVAVMGLGIAAQISGVYDDAPVTPATKDNHR